MKRRSSRISVKISSKYCSLVLDIRHQEWYRNAVREKTRSWYNKAELPLSPNGASFCGLYQSIGSDSGRAYTAGSCVCELIC
jgi:hypothetical protein